ncbi:EB_dh domain-containing protein [Psidium guajava]|nr:EB_dh domain-containing protein [Psidium guajava]
MLAACRGDVTGVKLRWSSESAMAVVMVSKGYPGAYDKGSLIWNHERAEVVGPSVKILLHREQLLTRMAISSRLAVVFSESLPRGKIWKKHAKGLTKQLKPSTGREGSAVETLGGEHLRTKVEMPHRVVH